MFAKLNVTHTDGTVVECAGRNADLVRFERQFHKPATQLFEDGGLYTEHLWYFGWLAEARVHEVPVFEEWIDTVEIVSVGSDEPEENPTNPDSSPTP